MINRLNPPPFSRTLGLVPPLLILTVQVADGATFLKIENATGGIAIPGETTLASHVNWIEVNSLQLGVANAAAINNGVISGSKATASDIVITKSLDRSSPSLFLACAQGTRQPKMVLEMTQTTLDNQVVFYRITLTGVVISSLNSSSGGERPTESVSLSYEKITTEYFMQDSKGNTPTTPTASSTWNFATNSTK